MIHQVGGVITEDALKTDSLIGATGHQAGEDVRCPYNFWENFTMSLAVTANLS
jgi:hypothetical protein